MVLAGSIGAFPHEPYAVHLERMCDRVEVRNLSRTGYGAWALRKRFRQQVLENRRLDLDRPDLQHWLVFQGGLNSVATPERTNWHLRELFLLAHGRGFRVVGLSLTPWGRAGDRRFAGARGLSYARATRKVVDFVAGRSSPAQALGAYAARRAVEGAPWEVAERPEIGVDLYDSPLRDAAAAPGDFDQAAAALSRDPAWRRSTAGLDEPARSHALHADALALTQLPRWFLRPELRSFDHIHPNREGHRLIFEIVCPRLPADWGCACASAPETRP